MPDNPYRSPTSTRPDDLAAGTLAGAGSPRLGGLIWTVLIVDTLPCLLRLFISCEEVFTGHARELLLDYPETIFQRWALVAGIGVCGTCGNLLILLKQRAGIPLAIASIVLTALLGGVFLWTQRNMSPHRDYLLLAAAEMVRFGWLVFYAIVLRMAARKLARPERVADVGHG